MGRLKLSLALLTACAVALTALAGGTVGAEAAVAVGVAGIMAFIALTAWALTRQVQLGTQRAGHISASVEQMAQHLAKLDKESSLLRTFPRSSAEQLEQLNESVQALNVRISSLESSHEVVEEGLRNSQHSVDQLLPQVKRLRATTHAGRLAVEAMDTAVHEIDERSGVSTKKMDRVAEQQADLLGTLDLLQGQVTGRIDQLMDDMNHALSQMRGDLASATDHLHGPLVHNLNESTSELTAALRQVDWAALVNAAEGIEARGADLRTAQDKLHSDVSAIATTTASAANLAVPETTSVTAEWAEAQADSIQKTLSRINTAVNFQSYQIPREIEASKQLFDHFAPQGLMPATGGWALSPVGTLEIVRKIQEVKPTAVLECGSGTSTIWMAMALRKLGGGRVYALEHDPDHVETTRSLIDDHGLAQYAEILHAPLKEYRAGDATITWYDDAALGDIPPVGVMLIDGPPAAVTDGRSHTLRFTKHLLANEAWLFADDYNRLPERSMVQTWLQHHPELRLTHSATKLQAVLHWEAMQ